jgi:hypothetical protein
VVVNNIYVVVASSKLTTTCYSGVIKLMVVDNFNDGTFNDHGRPHFFLSLITFNDHVYTLTTTVPVVIKHFSCTCNSWRSQLRHVALPVTTRRPARKVNEQPIDLQSLLHDVLGPSAS